MESTESMEARKQMVKMHDYFQKKIEAAIGQGDYFEASWHGAVSVESIPLTHAMRLRHGEGCAAWLAPAALERLQG